MIYFTIIDQHNTYRCIYARAIDEYDKEMIHKNKGKEYGTKINQA